MSETTLLYLTFPDILQYGQADKALARAQVSLDADPRIVDTTHLSYDVESYFIANGLPVADTELGIDCTTMVEVGALSALGSYPRPYTVDLAAASRWLPLDGTFDDGQQHWAPFQGASPIRLNADGTTPTPDDEYEYLLGRQFAVGPAVRLDGGDYFMTDELGWGQTSVTLALVAVLHAPAVEAYGLIETYPPDSVDPNRSFVGLRYGADGQVTTHVKGLAAIRQTSGGQARTGQPVVVALRIASPKVAEVAIVDRTLTHWSASLPDPHPYDARLYVGRSPGVELGSASMDILEVGYWIGLDTAGMLSVVNQLDALYGVSR